VDAPDRLEGDGVTLRPLRVDDAAHYAAAFRDDPELGRWTGFETDPDEAWVRERVADAAQRAGFELAVTAEGSDTLRGVVIVHHVEPAHRRAEVGFWLVRDARGKGLGARAVVLVVRWLFDEAGLRRLELSTTPDNRAAQILARRLGFRHEGVMRQRDVERGRPADVVWFGLLRDEWQRARNRTGSHPEHVPTLYQPGES
jgi:ribosomal-protein-alanine N-acetyltransferase